MKPRLKMISVTNKARALTFIELLIVIIVIGILSGLSVPRFRKTFQGIQQNNFIRDIYSLSRYLQASAIAKGEVYCLNIDTDREEFSASRRQEGQLQGLKGRFSKIYKTPAGLSLSVEPGDKTSIYFYPDGSMDKAVITLEDKAGNKRISLHLKGAAGGIQVE